MKKTGLIALLAGLLAVLLAFSGCADPDRLRYENDTHKYVREGDGAVFYRASANYLAVRINKNEEVGSIDRVDEDDLPLYVIYNYEETERLDPDQYMSDASYNVYYVEGVTMPKLWDMEIDRIRIVENSTVSYSVGEIDEAETLKKVIDAYQNGMSVSYNSADCNFRIREGERRQLAFSSAKYGGFYYILQYYRFDEGVEMTREVTDFDSFTPEYDFPYTLEEHNGKTYVRYDLGKNFLYDRATGLCHPMGDLIEPYFNKNT